MTEPTMIVDPPKSQVVLAGSQVSFTCNATADTSELGHLKIEWKKNGEAFKFNSNDSWSIVDGGRRLIIKKIEVKDSGQYTCTASTRLDSDTVTAVLTVKGTVIQSLLCIFYLNVVRTFVCKFLEVFSLLTF